MAKDKKSIKYEADISGFKKNIETAEKSIKTLNNQLKLNKAQLEGNKNSIQLLSQKLELLKNKNEEQIKVVENTRKEYEKAVETYGKNSTEAEKLKNELIQAETKQQSIANSIEKTNKQLDFQSNKLIATGNNLTEFGETANKAGNKIEKAGNKLSILSAGVATLAGASLKASISFESDWAGVTKTVDGTEKQMSELREGILDLSTQLPSTAKEIAGVAENAGQLGIQTENVLSFTKAMIDMGNSTNLNSDEASSQLAKFANIMQMSQDNFDRLGSSIVELGNNFATTEADIVDMSMRLAGAGKQVGLSEGQVLGLATALSSVGIEAEMGGSAISKTMIKMQNAVELGGNKLDSVLKRTGLTLRELELMSANNSKGFKDLSQSIGMTSTEVKQLITAGTNLEDFANVSGMTVEQFKKAWKEDATGALTAFIKGLGDAENKGESAITMLSEMGLTEVRLRDSLLRAANAGDLFNNAIETGTRAWEENTALADEANKRYDTTESKLKMLKNEIVKNGIALGDELKPALIDVLEEVKPLISNITNGVKEFNKLDTATKKNIIRIGAMVVALGPAVKISGKAIKTLGSGVTAVGALTKAIGVMTTKTNSGVKEVDSLAKTLSNLKSPTSLATMGITALIGTITYLAIKQSEATKETREFADEIKKQKEEYEEYNNSIDKTTQANISQINSVSNLKDELKNLVDENGNVKQGYESRVNFILKQLSETLGIECKLNGNVIESYKKLQGEIDATIEKKKAEIILDSKKQKYQKAVEEEAGAVENLRNANEKLGMSIEEARLKYENLKDEKETFEKKGKIYNSEYFNTAEEMKNIKNLIDAYEKAENVVKQCTQNKKDYENAYTLYVEEKYNEISNTIIDTTNNWTNSSLKDIKDTIKKESGYLDDYKQIHKDTANEVALQNQKQSEQNLQNLANELAQRKSTVEKMSEEEIEAWSMLAESSYEVYKNTISNMHPDMQEEIQETIGVLVEGTPYAIETAENYINSIVNSLNKDEQFRQRAVSSLNAYMLGLSDEEQRNLIEKAGIEDVDSVLRGLEEGKRLSEEKGIEIIKALTAGLKNDNAVKLLNNQAKTIGTIVAGGIIATIPKGKQTDLPGHKDGLDYVPYDNYVARLHKGERVLTKEEAREYANGNINNKVMTNNNNIIMQFYPQNMSEFEMEKAFAYVNLRLGKSY